MSKLHINISPEAIAELYTLPVAERNRHAHGIFHRTVEVESYKYHAMNTSLPIEELQGAGYLGLYNGLNTYVIGRGNFVSYCWYYIHGFILNYVKRESKHASRYAPIGSALPGSKLENLVIDNVGYDDSMVKGLLLSSDISHTLFIMRHVLTEGEFDVLWQVYVEDVPIKSIAKSLHIKLPWVKVIIEVSLDKVRKALSKENV